MQKIFLFLLLMAVAFIGGVWFANSSYYPVSTKTLNFSPSNFSTNKNQKQIIETLTRQSAAWSSGDIGTFMKDYWDSKKLRFASGGTVKRGWQTTLDRYKARYPNKTAMGTLTFTDLEVDILSGNHALVFGRWTLTRDGDTPTGLFTLHMVKLNGVWKIVSDHTSVEAL